MRLDDVADVDRLACRTQRTGAWFEGKPAEGLAIQREAGANTIQVVDTIKALLPKLQESIPPSVHVDLVSDRSLVIRAAVHDVQFTMMLTIGLVDPRHLHLPADAVGDGDPEHGGAAVAARDLRGHVRRSATASTTSR